VSNGVAAVLEALDQHGVLLKQDTQLRSVVSIILGRPLRGSWWGHDRAHEIFAVLTGLTDHPDVLFTKLLRRKDTLVHRRLWPDLLAVGRERATWQLSGLSDAAVSLLKKLDENGEPVVATGIGAKELRNRLLAVGTEVHREGGMHAVALESWTAWSERVGCAVVTSAGESRAALESVVLRSGASPEALPWNR
jgi:hypothetical protein